MNKSDLIEHIASHAELTKSQSEEALNAILNGISDALASGDNVALIGVRLENGKNPTFRALNRSYGGDLIF